MDNNRTWTVKGPAGGEYDQQFPTLEQAIIYRAGLAIAFPELKIWNIPILDPWGSRMAPISILLEARAAFLPDEVAGPMNKQAAEIMERVKAFETECKIRERYDPTWNSKEPPDRA